MSEEVLHEEPTAPQEPSFKIHASTVEVLLNGNTYIFKIPTVRQTTRISQKAKALRIADGGDGSAEGLSPYEVVLYRAIATIEELLTTSSDARFFSEDDKKTPVVDSSKWDTSITDDYILEVFDGYLSAIDSFRSGNTR